MLDVKLRIIHVGNISMNKFWGETERVHKATATCTLLESEGVRLLADPSPHPHELEAELYRLTGLRPAQIDAVFVTHFHGDHRYGLPLFPDAQWLMAPAGLEEWRQAQPSDEATISRFVSPESRLPAGIDLYPAPGHTLGLCALMADTVWGRTIIAGDAVMNREFLAAEEGYHNSVDFGLAAETIRRIRYDADVIVAGHDGLLRGERDH